jgi:hypothetical protein
MVSDELPDWPVVSMLYTCVTDAYFEDIANPGDTVLYWPLAGTQTTVKRPLHTIPTFNEWGMIILCVLLFGCGAWVIVRRHRKATVSI